MPDLGFGADPTTVGAGSGTIGALIGAITAWLMRGRRSSGRSLSSGQDSELDEARKIAEKAREDVEEMKLELHGVKSQLTGVASDVTEMRTKLDGVDRGILHLNSTLARLEGYMQARREFEGRYRRAGDPEGA